MTLVNKITLVNGRCFLRIAISSRLSKTFEVRQEFIEAITVHQQAFGIELPGATVDQLADYYELVQRDNPLLHLVGPCSAEEFATRHILESLTILEFLPKNARVADVGTGAGLPAIPCLIARDDLNFVLIESKEKKTKFLDTASRELGLQARGKVVNRQFEEVEPAGFDHVTCRALDKFTEKLPRLFKWARGKRALLFGGNNLRDALRRQEVSFNEKRMPMSEQRFLFVLNQPKERTKRGQT